jgi:hypothetical protein
VIKDTVLIKIRGGDAGDIYGNDYHLIFPDAEVRLEKIRKFSGYVESPGGDFRAVFRIYWG